MPRSSNALPPPPHHPHPHPPMLPCSPAAPRPAATLMNKGLEVIEAHYLFGADYDNIEIGAGQPGWGG